MKISYIIVGTTIVLIGAAIYYLIKKAKDTSPYNVDFKEVDTIKYIHLGEWLKSLDVDLNDFGVTRRLFVIKNILPENASVRIPKEIQSKIESARKTDVLAFVLSDMQMNTKSAIIVVGNNIEQKLLDILVNEVTEIHLK